MELIQIIYNVLLYGWVLLVLVVVISFIRSRKKNREDDSQQEYNTASSMRKTGPKQNSNDEQQLQRKGQTTPNLQIFRLSQYRQKEVKVVRQPTITERDAQEKDRSEEEPAKNTSGDGKRYTIVNEKMKKTKSNAANYYL